MKNFIKKMLLKLMHHFTKVRPEKILFINFLGKGYGCNPKYIAEELLKRNRGYDLVWAVSNLDDESIPSKIRKVRINRFKYFYELATCKILVSNVRMPMYFQKRKNQLYIQTWHGCVPLKKIEAAVEDKLSLEYVQLAKNDSSNIDLLISNSGFCTNIYQQDFWYQGKILESGSPRNDVFFAKNKDCIKEKICKQYHIALDKKIILYAPTFRNSADYNYFTIDFKKLVAELKNEYVVLIRLHPNVSNNQYDYDDMVINANDYGDTQELLCISDILITDYSSMMFDALYTNHSTYLYAPDYEDYLDERGLYFPYTTLPFPIAKQGTELIQFILTDAHADFKKKKKAFMHKLQLYDDGGASEKVCDEIDAMMNVQRKRGSQNE